MKTINVDGNENRVQWKTIENCKWKINTIWSRVLMSCERCFSIISVKIMREC